MDSYVSRMLDLISSSTRMAAVEISPDNAAGFVGRTGYIDRIKPADFAGRAADVLYGRDPHGRVFVSVLVLDTRLEARTLLELARGGETSEDTREALRYHAKPRVLTLFQRYAARESLFVTAGNAYIGTAEDCPAEFFGILFEDPERRYQRLSLEDIAGIEGLVPVPEHAAVTVESYHIDGSVGVVDV